MPKGDAYFAGLIPHGTNKSNVRLKIVKHHEAIALERALNEDAADLYYSAWVSFLDAMRGIDNQCATWATVKLYYSTFYSLRSYLALSRICIFHVASSAFSVRATAGETPTICTERGSHKVVLGLFNREHHGNELLSQRIDLENPLDWLMEKRESANYRNAKFSEPNPPEELDYITSNGLRKSLGAYVADRSMLYVFDRDHALVAYPLRALQVVGEQLAISSVTISLSHEQQKFLKSKASDKDGGLNSLIQEMKRFKLVS